MNGEMPMPDYRWEDELADPDRNEQHDTMTSVDALFDPPPEE
jgi:hypothetical protein